VAQFGFSRNYDALIHVRVVPMVGGLPSLINGRTDATGVTLPLEYSGTSAGSLMTFAIFSETFYELVG